MRKIVHIDMDCFYAAVETRENPNLINHPVAVGGRPETRGVVAACNYEARAFGIHSAMPMSQAIRKCPDLIMLPVNMSLYRQVSKSIHKIFKRYTHLIQPLSLDEAYLDVSSCNLFQGSATYIAKDIRNAIACELKLNASAGIAPNKFLAKIASDWNKPNGQFVVHPNAIESFILQLPVKKIFGVGKVTNLRMSKMGIKTCADLQMYSQIELIKLFGKFGKQLYSLARGIDERAVQTTSIRKSLSIEDTFAIDKMTLDDCLNEVAILMPKLLLRLETKLRKKHSPIKALYIKLRFNNFKTTTAQQITQTIDENLYKKLISKAWYRYKLPVRLIGLGIEFSTETDYGQLELPFEN
jgi:DNA polymerase-4